MGKHIYTGLSWHSAGTPQPTSILLDHNLRKRTSTKPITAKDVPIDAPRGSEVVDHPDPGLKD